LKDKNKEKGIKRDEDTSEMEEGEDFWGVERKGERN